MKLYLTPLSVTFYTSSFTHSGQLFLYAFLTSFFSPQVHCHCPGSSIVTLCPYYNNRERTVVLRLELWPAVWKASVGPLQPSPQLHGPTQSTCPFQRLRLSLPMWRWLYPPCKVLVRSRDKYIKSQNHSGGSVYMSCNSSFWGLSYPSLCFKTFFFFNSVAGIQSSGYSLPVYSRTFTPHCPSQVLLRLVSSLFFEHTWAFSSPSWFLWFSVLETSLSLCPQILPILPFQLYLFIL